MSPGKTWFRKTTVTTFTRTINQGNISALNHSPGETVPDIEPKKDKPRETSRVYAILDKVADALTGGLQLHKHEAAAVRVFVDIANDPQTTIAHHPEDFELVCLGQLNEDHTLTAMARPLVILTGAAWKAAQTPRPTQPPRAD